MSNSNPNPNDADSMDVDSNTAQPNKMEADNNNNNDNDNNDNNDDKHESMTDNKVENGMNNNNENVNKKKVMDVKKKADLRNKLKKLVAIHRNTVTVGCGNWRCMNPYCKSNINNGDKIYSDTEASKLALKMIKLKHKKCDEFKKYRDIIPLSSKNINREIIINAFTHFDILYECFIDSKIENVTEQDLAIDFIELDRTFHAIMKEESLCKDAVDTLEKSMNLYLKELICQKTKNVNNKLSLNELRALVILIECPLVLSEDIDCHNLLHLILSIFAEINSFDFKSIKIIHKWFSKYLDLDRLRRILHSLHQYMTLIITMREDEIEDYTEDWKIELKYDDTDDNDERDEIQQEIEKKQQNEREKYIKNDISAVVKFIDMIFIANKIIIGDNKIDIDNKMDIDDEEEEEFEESKSEKHSISLILRKPLDFDLFHNDGLNEAICSRGDSRCHIHRRDFIHYREHDFFTYLSYPYLLSAGSKCRYLEFENLLRQHRARRRRMFDLMLSGGMNLISGGMNRNQLIEELDLVLRIRRNSIIPDTLGILQLQEPWDLRKRLRIIFDGEQGIDQGGLTKEYFQLIMKELFDPNYAMFVYNDETNCYWFNRDSFDIMGGDTKTMLTNYELVGKLVGIAIYNNTILDLRFPRVIFKKLLENEPINFIDFRDYDPEMAKAFELLLQYQPKQDVEMIYCRNFVIKYKNIFGQEKEYDLLGNNGGDIMLNHSNRQKYVDLYIKYVLINCIEQQFNAFLKGFKTVCDSELFQKYSSSELELLICGSKEFDFDALESSTRYQDGLHKNSRIVRDFWCIVHGLSDNDKRKLLSFCTGSDRVPINGLGELTLTISKNGNDNNKLPTSHTCFNHLLLPEYSTKDILKTRLLTAIQNSEGFGLL